MTSLESKYWDLFKLSGLLIKKVYIQVGMVIRTTSAHPKFIDFT